MKQGGYRSARSGLSRHISRHDKGGFTIVEVLIVLAVTGMLFVAAALAINGRQNKTEFMTAINDLRQQFQQIISETSSGYPGNTNFNCQGTSGGGAPTITASGTSSGCTFLGKVIQFGTTNDSDTGHLVVYPIVGNQQINNSGKVQQVQSLSEAYPVAVAPNNPISTVDATATYALEGGLKVYAPTGAVGAIGIMSSLASYTGANCTGLCSGSQQFSLYTINGVTPNMNVTQVPSKIDKSNGTGFVQADGGVTVCVVSDATNQSGLFTIGGNGGLALTLQVKAGKQC